MRRRDSPYKRSSRFFKRSWRRAPSRDQRLTRHGTGNLPRKVNKWRASTVYEILPPREVPTRGAYGDAPSRKENKCGTSHTGGENARSLGAVHTAIQHRREINEEEGNPTFQEGRKAKIGKVNRRSTFTRELPNNSRNPKSDLRGRCGTKGGLTLASFVEREKVS